MKLCKVRAFFKYSFVTLHVKHKKLPFLAVFPWFLILSKSQDGSQDGDHCEWRHSPPAAPPSIKYTSSCWEDQRLSAEGKIVSKYCNISQHNSGEGFHQPPPPPAPLYHGGGMNLRVRPRVKLTNMKFRVAVRWPTMESIATKIYFSSVEVWAQFGTYQFSYMTYIKNFASWCFRTWADVFLEKNQDFSGSHICKGALIYQ